MAESLREIPAQEIFNNILKKGGIRKIFHSDEGVNHWTDLYEVFDENTKCNGTCETPAKFLLYTHWHNNFVTLIPACERHSPPMWFHLLEKHTSG